MRDAAPTHHRATVNLEMEFAYDAKLQARRLRMQHDDNFYGPMKGAKCGCQACEMARAVIRLSDALLAAPPLVTAD